MPRDLILGTAGHIDHGKTSLVLALTGVDCDRLPEEKARGITIDIGFASLELPGLRLGVVDVPGHERFVRNMVAGATGFDLALLVVAADDGVMPQTREHLEILQLLDLRRGVVALTKSDLVDAETLELVALEVRDLVRGTFLETAAIVPTATPPHGRAALGLDALKLALSEAGAAVTRADDDRPFRLAIDRAFTLPGHGTVVTGSVHSGELRPEDALEMFGPDGVARPVRVRALSQHGRPVEVARRGQRAALNLAGVTLDEVRRGHELAAPGTLTPTRVLSVTLRASAGGAGVKHRLPVRVHLGTGDIAATVSVLDADRVEPGRWGPAQLFLESPAVAEWGQPFVLRNSSGERTLGGGRVLLASAGKLRRRQTDAVEALETLAGPDAAARCLAAAWFAGLAGVDADDLLTAAGVSRAEATRHLVPLAALPGLPGRHLHPGRLAEVEAEVLAVLGELHVAQPLATGHERGAVANRLHYREAAVVGAVLEAMVRGKRLAADGKRVARPDFRPKLSAAQRKLRDRIVEEHRAAGFEPPEPKGYANLAGGNASALGEIFDVACAEGLLVRVSAEVYLHHEADATLRRRVTELLSNGAVATVAEIRDALGTSRKFAVPICEYLDRAGVTRRDGDRRALRTE